MMHICRFDTDLSELKKSEKFDPEAVKAVLRKTGRFSCFDICDDLAPTISRLLKNGEVVVTGGQYPWSEVEVKNDTNS